MLYPLSYESGDWRRMWRKIGSSRRSRWPVGGGQPVEGSTARVRRVYDRSSWAGAIASRPVGREGVRGRQTFCLLVPFGLPRRFRPRAVVRRRRLAVGLEGLLSASDEVGVGVAAEGVSERHEELASGSQGDRAAAVEGVFDDVVGGFGVFTPPVEPVVVRGRVVVDFHGLPQALDAGFAGSSYLRVRR
ncbi:MAG: hypothetical protein WAW85_10325 [Gordonia sp. (in: high G+C Gram-positive bacteria)]|uniref:hypothetical protein n=1 Tax=Gordonia sp. (in: high G+C Gram-positive bacteria) TaxID=84139 RepID=UPI003BB69231